MSYLSFIFCCCLSPNVCLASVCRCATNRNNFTSCSLTLFFHHHIGMVVSFMQRKSVDKERERRRSVYLIHSHAKQLLSVGKSTFGYWTIFMVPAKMVRASKCTSYKSILTFCAQSTWLIFSHTMWNAPIITLHFLLPWDL